MALLNIPHNAYPTLPETAFVRTSVPMVDVQAYISTKNATLDIKDAVAMIFRNEGGNGAHGVNNNYIGEQADGYPIGHGMDSKVIATCVEAENGTHKPRRFCCFDSWKDSVDILFEEVTRKQLFVGGLTDTPYCKMKIGSITDWTEAYYKEWVAGNINATPTTAYYTLFKELYAEVQKVIK